MGHNGQYAVKIINEAGEATSVANVVVEKEATPPPRPPDPVSDSGRDTRDHSPASRSTTSVSVRELGPESQALKTLATFKRHSRPLPDLLPFPFSPDEPTSRPKRNNTKVPKPSKFTKGEMYYSDYESDFEGNIGVKWRASQSDTEDLDNLYRKVHPVLSKGFKKQQKPERQPSPPCPHKWESHDEIDQLASELRKPKRVSKVVKAYDKKEEVMTSEDVNIVISGENKEEVQTSENVSIVISGENNEEENTTQFYEATAIVRSHSNISITPNETIKHCETEPENPPPLPAKLKVNVLTPCSSMRSVDSGSYSDETNLTMSSQSTVQTTVNSSSYVKVKEKVMHFEKKVEEDYLKQVLEAELGETSSSGTVRPDRIPGAVRVLPTPTPPGSRPGSRPESRSSSRKHSLARSNSSDNNLAMTRVFSPVNTLSRSVQPSPIFGRKHHEQPPPMFVPPDFNIMKQQQQKFTVDSSVSNTSTLNKSFEEPIPPTKFETPLVVEGKPRPDIDLEKTVEEIKRVRNQVSESNAESYPSTLSSGEQHTASRCETSTSFVFKTERQFNLTSPPPLETVTKENYDEKSRFIANTRFQTAERRSRSRSILSDDDERERLMSPKLVLMANNGIKRGSIDGYEADTDTLKSRRGSVKNIASIFERREISNPSPVPRPASAQHFTMSTAYVAPKWAEHYQTEVRSYNQTQILRINQQSVQKSQSTDFMKKETTEMKSENFESKFALAVPDSGALTQPPTSPCDPQTSQKIPFNFQPKKFEATIADDTPCSKSLVNDNPKGEKLKAKWLPESVADINQQPHYKSVKPSLSRTVTPSI